MKCEGVENQPCIRCSKVGRKCVPQTSSRKTRKVQQPATQQFSARPLTDTAKLAYNSPSQTIPRPSYLTSRSPTNVQSNSGNANGLVSSRRIPLSRGDTASSSTNETFTELPSIYSRAPIDTVIEANLNSEEASPHMLGSISRKRKRQSTSTTDDRNLPTPTQSYQEDDPPINRKDMRDIIAL